MTAPASTSVPVVVQRPGPGDAGACRDLAAATGVLDVNSQYAYALWFRDFAATSVVARIDGRLVGFITGFRRPEEPSTLFVWQVAVDASARGRGVAGAMLDAMVAVPAGDDGAAGVDHLETTITPDNDGSIALFTAFANRHGAQVGRSELFGPDVLGVEHLPEVLFRIGPITRG